MRSASGTPATATTTAGAVPSVLPGGSSGDGASQLFAWLEPRVSEVDGCRLEAVRDDAGGWWSAPAGLPEPVVAAAVSAARGVEVALPGRAWGGAVPLRPRGAVRQGGAIMVVSALVAPRPSRVLRLHVIALRESSAALCRAASALLANARQLAAAAESVTAENESFRSLHLAHRRLSVAAGANGPAGVAEALRDATGRPVAVWHGGSQVAAVEVGGDPPVPPGPPEPPGPPGDVPEGRAVRSGGWLWFAAPAGDGQLTLVGVGDGDGDAGRVTAALLEDAAALAAQEMRVLTAERGAGPMAWSHLADGLLSDEDGGQVRARAGALGYDIDRPHRVVAVRGTTDAAGAADAVARAARAQRATALATTHEGDVVLVTPDELDLGALLDHVRAQQGGRPVLVGTSSWHRRGEGLSGALREARTALRLAADTADGRVVHFDDLGIVRLLAGAGDTSELRRYVRRWLGPLLDYDRRRGTELARTVAVYLGHGGSVARSSEALIIHASTLKYRLSRAAALTGLDLNDPEARFHLQLAGRASAALAALGPDEGPAGAPVSSE